MVAAEWMPMSVRLPHTIEILADELTYVGVLVLLLFKLGPATSSTRSQVLSGASGT
jgi:hypothetical protein